MDFVKKYINETISIANLIDKEQILNLINQILVIKKNKGRIFFLGVGGSAANSSHAVNDFRKISNIECYAPFDNFSEMSARINDDGWDKILFEWLKTSKLNKKDCIFILSVGGGSIKKHVSLNLVNALKLAKLKKAKVFGIVGKKDGFTYKNADNCILIPTINKKNITPHSESFQSVILHLIVSHPKLKENSTKW